MNRKGALLWTIFFDVILRKPKVFVMKIKFNIKKIEDSHCWVQTDITLSPKVVQFLKIPQEGLRQPGLKICFYLTSSIKCMVNLFNEHNFTGIMPGLRLGLGFLHYSHFYDLHWRWFHVFASL